MQWKIADSAAAIAASGPFITTTRFTSTAGSPGGWKLCGSIPTRLDPDQTYHIGTGQSSDSLMWDNRFRGTQCPDGVCPPSPEYPPGAEDQNPSTSLICCGIRFPGISSAPGRLIRSASSNMKMPRTARLDERLNAARRVADRGILVGFHFHPMIYY